MTNKDAQISPNLYAPIGGVAYLIIIVAGAMGEIFIRSKLIVSGDAAATTKNISDSPLLWRIGIFGDLVMHVFDLVLSVVYYTLFRRVNKILALLSLLFGMIQTAVLVANKLNLMMPLFLMENAQYLKAFSQQQLQDWSYLSIQTHEYGFAFGLTNTYLLLFSPKLESTLFPVLLGPLAFIGEFSLCLWLLIKGVNSKKLAEWSTTA